MGRTGSARADTGLHHRPHPKAAGHPAPAPALAGAAEPRRGPAAMAPAAAFPRRGGSGVSAAPGYCSRK